MLASCYLWDYPRTIQTVGHLSSASSSSLLLYYLQREFSFCLSYIFHAFFNLRGSSNSNSQLNEADPSLCNSTARKSFGQWHVGKKGKQMVEEKGGGRKKTGAMSILWNAHVENPTHKSLRPLLPLHLQSGRQFIIQLFTTTFPLSPLCHAPFFMASFCRFLSGLRSFPLRIWASDQSLSCIKSIQDEDEDDLRPQFKCDFVEYSPNSCLRQSIKTL